MKGKFFLVTTIILFLLLGAAIGFGYWYNENFMKAQEVKVAELNSYYAEMSEDLTDRYNTVLAEKEALSAELEKLKKDYDVVAANLKACETTLAEYNDKIEAANKAEEERLSALSEEDRKAEERAREYVLMVKTLKAENSEYRELYESLVTYLNKDKLTDKERASLIDKYEKLLSIQKEYTEKNTAKDVSADD